MSTTALQVAGKVQAAFGKVQRSPEEDEFLGAVLNHCESHPDVGQSISKDLKSRLPLVRNKIGLAFFLLDLARDAAALERVDAHARFINNTADFHEFFWNLTSRLFRLPRLAGAELPGCRGKFRTLSAELRRNFGTVPHRTAYPRPKRIAIVMPQFLQLRHSPSREAVNIALHLQEERDCEVVIVNGNSMSYTNELGIFNPFIANAVDAYNGFKEMSLDYMKFKDAKVKLLSFPAGRMTSDKIHSMLVALERLEIDSVISHADNLFVQELVFGQLPSIFATTGGVVPLARSDGYWVPATLFDAKAASIAEKHGHQNFFKESMLTSPEDTSSPARHRSDFGLDSEAILFLVVSTRLQAEMTGEFAETCKAILASSERHVILFAGSADVPLAQFFGGLEATRRVVNIGFQDDLAALCKMCDIYLNPYRQGGGTSSQTALMCGMPVLTRNFGHIFDIVPADTAAADWSSYLHAASRLAGEPEFRRKFASRQLDYLNQRAESSDQIRRLYDYLSGLANAY